MKSETAEHLNKTENAIWEAKKLLAKHGYPDTLRTVVVIGFMDQMIEHHESMLLLVRNNKVGSAFVLARKPSRGLQSSRGSDLHVWTCKRSFLIWVT
jgi:hypothetical protein